MVPKSWLAGDTEIAGASKITCPSTDPKVASSKLTATSRTAGTSTNANGDALPLLPATTKLTLKTTVPSATVTPAALGSSQEKVSFPLLVSVVPKLPAATLTLRS